MSTTLEIVAPAELTAEQINARVLAAIRASALDQFTTGLAWAQWCHALAMAAADGDERAIKNLTADS